MTASRTLVEDAPVVRRARVGTPGVDRHTAHDVRRTDGPLVCVAGGCGGAGTTTVALLLAWHATQVASPVLCLDAAGPTADLHHLAGACSMRSLAATAEALARGHLEPAGLFANALGGLRVIASHGRIEPPTEGVGHLLSLARQAHGLCVADVGTLCSPAAFAAYEQASHIVWVLPSTPTGAKRAARTLAAVQRHPTARELVVARACDRALGRVRPRELQRLAQERHSPLIALPHVGKLELPSVRERALTECRIGLQELCRLTVGARAR